MAGLEDVVIVGGGPVGLFLAGELRLAGVGVVLLERRPEPTAYTKGMAIHARTVEQLAMRGFAETFLDGGVRVPGWHFGFLEQRVDFTRLDSPYPFVLSFPQDRAEAVLEERALALGARVLRGQEVTGLAPDESGIQVLTRDDTWRAGWVVGTDGAGSTVRQAAGIAFPGAEASFFSFLGDVVADQPPAPGFNAVNERGSMMVAPLPGGLVRIAGYDPQHQQPGRREVTLEELREISARIAGADFGLHDPKWLTRFDSATRLADAYRSGRVLLAGDAAHMHFPAGGVGLNLGLQDAMNLGWKLAAVVQGRAPEALLDTYEAERRPWGDDVARHTLAQTALMTAISPEGLALRALLAELLGTHADLSRTLARRISAVNVRYRAADPGAHPLTGARIAALGDHLTDARAVLVTPHDLPEAEAAAAALGVRVARGPFPGLAATTLIRPDGYVWWATDAPEPDAEAASALTRIGVRFGR